MAQFMFLLLVYDGAEHGGDFHFSCITLVDQCVWVCVKRSKNNAIKHKNKMREIKGERKSKEKTNLRARTKSKNAKRQKPVKVSSTSKKQQQ